MAEKKKPPRRRHVPQRTCIACRRVGGKRELIRIVRSPDQSVEVDPTGKARGRGAYLCHDQACWEKALRGNLLDRALRTALQPQDRVELMAFAAALSPDPPAEAPLGSTQA